MKKLKLISLYKLLLLITILLYCFIRTKVIKYSSIYNLDTNTLIGTITDYDIKSNYIKIALNAKELVECYIYGEDIDTSFIKIGYKVKLTGTMKEILNNTIPNTFNYKEYLYNKKIYYTFNIDNIILINKDISFLDKIKNFTYERCLNIDNTGYLAMFILGKKDIDKETLNNLRQMNIIHIFSISGIYLSLITITLSCILNKKRSKNYINIIIFIMYLLLTSFNISLLKSFLLSISIGLKKKYNLNISNSNILIYNLLFLLIINPFYLYDIGFQYSYLCTYGILSNMDKSSFIKSSIKTSLICLIYSLPLSISLNYSYNILSILFNIIYIPFISYIFYPLCILSFICKFFYPVLLIFINILNSSVSFLSSMKLFIIILPKLSILSIIIYYLIVLLYTYKRKYIYVFLLILIITINKVSYYLDSNAYLYFLDVGQGDSSLIISPYMKDITLIDTGGGISNLNQNISKNIVTFLYSINIKKIDNLIISHGDCDHICNGSYIKKYINISNVVLNKGDINDKEKEYIEMMGSYKYKNMALINLYNDVSSEENDNSIFTYFKLYNVKFLYSGDASKEMEEKIINKHNLSVDILKIGHHGSKTSSSSLYLSKLNPSLALISSGRGNMYNHPSKDTLDTLNKLNIKYLDTQDVGSVRFSINKEGYSIKTFNP